MVEIAEVEMGLHYSTIQTGCFNFALFRILTGLFRIQTPSKMIIFITFFLATFTEKDHITPTQFQNIFLNTTL